MEVVAVMGWEVGGVIRFDEPKPLVPIHSDRRLTGYVWPPSKGYVEPELVALSFALSGSTMRLVPEQSRGGRGTE
jgi:hypothetical protein